MDDFPDAPVFWQVLPYTPYATEFETDMQWRSAARQIEPALRLTKLALSEISGPGAALILAAYRLPLDAVPAVGACAVCGQELGRKHAVTSAGVAFHKRCVPGRVQPERVQDLLPFAEELEERRSITTLMALRGMRRKD
ncbi:hypothetical protein [uncultured Deinococcus sp.]|uniref:hypothetical protein n=1 Tax=uncultured Deinococcus sp. TaxID=158789 RepID=UPI002590866A|nr:hypothetical protein [uncultured Deinococcus sp.]